jgi:hypothetical protein
MNMARCSAGWAVVVALGLAAPALAQVHQEAGGGKPVASKTTQKKTTQKSAPKRAARPTQAAKSKQATQAKVKPPAVPKVATTRPPSSVATARPAAWPAAPPVQPEVRQLPPPLVWTPPPLGPERFYPNGIPPLRPEFMHPLPQQTSQAE